MRGTDKRSGELFSYVDLEQRVRADHPLRAIRSVVSEALDALSGEFAALYSGTRRPSIAPEMLLRAMLLQAFYSVRSERQLMERLEYDLLSMTDPAIREAMAKRTTDVAIPPEAIARGIAFAIEQPVDVDVGSIVIRPTAQD